MRASRGVGGCAALPPSAHPLGSTKKTLCIFPMWPRNSPVHTAVSQRGEGVFSLRSSRGQLISCTEILSWTCAHDMRRSPQSGPLRTTHDGLYDATFRSRTLSARLDLRPSPASECGTPARASRPRSATSPRTAPRARTRGRAKGRASCAPVRTATANRRARTTQCARTAPRQRRHPRSRYRPRRPRARLSSGPTPQGRSSTRSTRLRGTTTSTCAPPSHSTSSPTSPRTSRRIRRRARTAVGRMAWAMTATSSLTSRWASTARSTSTRTNFNLFYIIAETNTSCTSV